VNQSHHQPPQPLGELIPEGGELVLVTGQKDAADRLRVDDLGDRVGDRLEVPIAVGLDVSGVS